MIRSVKLAPPHDPAEPALQVIVSFGPEMAAWITKQCADVEVGTGTRPTEAEFIETMIRLVERTGRAAGRPL